VSNWLVDEDTIKSNFGLKVYQFRMIYLLVPLPV